MEKTINYDKELIRLKKKVKKLKKNKKVKNDGELLNDIKYIDEKIKLLVGLKNQFDNLNQELSELEQMGDIIQQNTDQVSEVLKMLEQCSINILNQYPSPIQNTKS